MNVLTHEQLVEITGFKTRRRQVEELNRMRIPCRVRGDGRPIVCAEDLPILQHGADDDAVEPNYEAI